RGGAHVDLAPDAVALRVVGGRAARRVPGDVTDDAVVRLDGLLEPAVHLGLAPVLHALVLDPLVVGDGHAARVADDVGDELDAALGQDAVALGRGRAVRAFGDELHLETFRDWTGDLAAQCGRDADVRIDVAQIVFRDLLRLWVAGDGAAQVGRVVVDVRDEVADVDAVRVVD